VIRYLARRLLVSILVLATVSVVVFGAVRLIPGDICRIVLDTPDVNPAQCTVIRRELGLDAPLPLQYARYMGGLATGNLGNSLISKEDVWTTIRRRMPLTVELTIFSTTIAALVGVPIGVVSALKRNSWIDYILRFVSVGWLSIPGFWVATMLIVLPATWWGYTPPSGYTNIWESPFTNLEQLYLPATSLGLALSAALARIIRSAMLEVVLQDYVRTAKAKGLDSRTIIVRHALKNAMLPVVTVFGIQFSTLMGGTVVVETIFNLPGMGTLLLRAVQRKDYVQVQGVVTVFALILIGINLIIDCSYAWIDPRIRYR
jgi:peptide/nickel transport system permease protein